MATELENDSQAHDVSARMVYAALMRTAKLSKKSDGEQTVFLGDEGVIQDMWGSRSIGGRDSFTVWDTILTV